MSLGGVNPGTVTYVDNWGTSLPRRKTFASRGLEEPAHASRGLEEPFFQLCCCHHLPAVILGFFGGKKSSTQKSPTRRSTGKMYQRSPSRWAEISCLSNYSLKQLNKLYYVLLFLFYRVFLPNLTLQIPSHSFVTVTFFSSTNKYFFLLFYF